MNSLITLHTQTINSQELNTVNARELHDFLEVKSKYYDWITKRIQDYGFQEGIDYICLTEKKVTQTSDGRNGSANILSHHITLDMAKELSMVERNEQGKQARKYFIECEKQLNQVIPKSLPEALRAYATEVEAHEKTKQQLQEAIKTKSYINDKKTASIAGKLGGTVKELNHVKTMLGGSKHGATINKVKKLTGIQYKWQPLNQWCVDNDIIPLTICLNDWDTAEVKVYPAQAWYDVHNIDLTKLF